MQPPGGRKQLLTWPPQPASVEQASPVVVHTPAETPASVITSGLGSERSEKAAGAKPPPPPPPGYSRTVARDLTIQGSTATPDGTLIVMTAYPLRLLLFRGLAAR